MCTNISPPPSSNVFLEHTGPVFGAHNPVQRYPPPRCTLHPSLPGAGRATPWQGHGPGAQIRWGSSQGAPQRVSQLSLHSIGQLCDGIRITPEVHLPFTFYDSRIGSLLFSAWKKKATGKSMMSTTAKHHKKDQLESVSIEQCLGLLPMGNLIHRLT